MADKKRAKLIRFRLSCEYIPLSDILKEFHFSSPQQFTRFCKYNLGDATTEIQGGNQKCQYLQKMNFLFRIKVLFGRNVLHLSLEKSYLTAKHYIAYRRNYDRCQVITQFLQKFHNLLISNQIAFLAVFCIKKLYQSFLKHSITRFVLIAVFTVAYSILCMRGDTSF